MQVTTDSPASPEPTEAGRWSLPVREIPVEERRLPPGVEERGGWVQVVGPPDLEGQEEDLDEDILYLRLIALRSLAMEKEEEELKEKEKEGIVVATEVLDNKEMLDTTEMLELLEEAEAASGDFVKVETTEVITIEDDDDDPISELKLHLHESYIATGFQKSIEVVDVTGSPSYSPTQSPEPLSPIYLPPEHSLSPPDSPSDCQVSRID